MPRIFCLDTFVEPVEIRGRRRRPRLLLYILHMRYSYYALAAADIHAHERHY